MNALFLLNLLLVVSIPQQAASATASLPSTQLNKEEEAVRKAIENEIRQNNLVLPAYEDEAHFFSPKNNGHFPYKAMVKDHTGYWSGIETFRTIKKKNSDEYLDVPDYADFKPFKTAEALYALPRQRCPINHSASSDHNVLFGDPRLSFQALDVKQTEENMIKLKWEASRAVQPEKGERWFFAHRPAPYVRWVNEDSLSYSEMMIKKSKFALWFDTVQDKAGAHFDFSVLYSSSDQTLDTPKLTGLFLGRGPKKTVHRVLVNDRIQMSTDNKLHVINLVTNAEHGDGMWSGLDRARQAGKSRLTKVIQGGYDYYLKTYGEKMTTFRDRISEYVGPSKDHYALSELNAVMATIFGVHGLLSQCSVYVHCWAGQTRSGGVVVLIILLSFMLSIKQDKLFIVPYYRYIGLASDRQGLKSHSFREVQALITFKAFHHDNDEHIVCKFVVDREHEKLEISRRECLSLVMYQVSRTIVGTDVVTLENSMLLDKLVKAENIKNFSRPEFKKLRAEYSESAKKHSKRLKATLQLRGDLVSALAFFSVYLAKMVTLFSDCFGIIDSSVERTKHMVEYANDFEKRLQATAHIPFPPRNMKKDNPKYSRYLSDADKFFLKDISRRANAVPSSKTSASPESSPIDDLSSFRTFGDSDNFSPLNLNWVHYASAI